MRVILDCSLLLFCSYYSRFRYFYFALHRFSFPNDERRQRWIAEVRKVRGPAWEPSKYTAICTLHFKKHDFFTQPRQKCMLLPRAVPWVTPLPQAKSVSISLRHIPLLMSRAMYFDCGAFSDRSSGLGLPINPSHQLCIA